MVGKDGQGMRSEDSQIGAKVRVGYSGLHSEWRGLTGTVSGKWGNPKYLGKVGQPQVPGPRHAAGARAHAAVLAPRARGDRRGSIGRKRRPWTGGAVP